MSSDTTLGVCLALVRIMVCFTDYYSDDSITVTHGRNSGNCVVYIVLIHMAENDMRD